MATTKSPPTPEPQPSTPAYRTPPTTLEAMLAQQRLLQSQIKAVRATLPKLSPQEKVIQQQAEHPNALITYQRAKARVKAGQPAAEAIDAILAGERAWIEEQLSAEGLNNLADCLSRVVTGVKRVTPLRHRPAR